MKTNTFIRIVATGLTVGVLLGLYANQNSGHSYTTYTSWMGDELKGRITASGEAFDPNGMTAASWFYDFDSRLLVEYQPYVEEPALHVIVRVNDRGPSKEILERGITLDISKAAFEQLAELKHGHIKVKVTLLGKQI